MQEHLRIEDPETARVLTDTKSVQLLVPFMKCPLSLSDAARELGVKLPMLSYHVKRFLELGLLEATASEHRGGRSVKRYRSTARTFSIPFELTPSETLEQLVTVLIEPETRRFRRELARTLQKLTPEWGFYIACNKENSISFSLKPHNLDPEQRKPFTDGLLGSDEPALVANEGRLQLDFKTAKAFQHELIELYERYMNLQHDDAQAYAFRLGLTPMLDESLE